MTKKSKPDEPMSADAEWAEDQVAQQQKIKQAIDAAAVLNVIAAEGLVKLRHRYGRVIIELATQPMEEQQRPL